MIRKIWYFIKRFLPLTNRAMIVILEHQGYEVKKKEVKDVK